MPITEADIALEKIRRERERRANKPAPLTLRGKNKDFFASDAFELMISGPAETGKTASSCVKLHHLMATTPKARGVMLRKTYASLISTVHETYKEVIARSDVQPVAYGGEKPQWYDYPNGSRLYLGGMDNAQKVLSGERDFIYFCQAEEATLQDWETLTTRATGRAGATDTPQVFGDCNPGPPTHWIVNRPSLKVIESRHIDNPRLYDADGALTAAGARSMGILEALTGILRERLYLGRWVAAEGLVFNFDKAIHLIDPFPIPPEWTRYRVIDFGFINPFACLWVARSPDGRLYVYRQHYHTQMLVSDHAKVIQAVERWYCEDGTPNPDREKITATLADHDAEDRATLSSLGIGTIPGPKAVRPGIDAVEELLKLDATKRPRLYVFRDSLLTRDERLFERRQPVCLEQEFDLYAYPKAADGKVQKEAPVKLYDHAIDPLRYLALWIKQTGGHGGGLIR
jgi:phage terminase large subunit